jgi:ubiquinone/menaquinone biosynthesis C-methylase UbiE
LTTLDLGCGDSKASIFFKGVDKRCGPQVDFVCDAENLSIIADGSVNAIYTERMLQHVPNDVQALREISRVLTDDGLAVIEVASTMNARLSMALNFLGIKRYAYTTFHVYTRKALTEKLKMANLKVLSYGQVPTHLGMYNHLFVVTKE